MKYLSILTISLFLILISSCNKHFQKVKSKNLNNQIISLEEMSAKIDALEIDTTSPEYKEHILISPDSSIFNNKEANHAYENLMKILIQKKKIKKNNQDGLVVEIESYDATDNCYVFCVLAKSLDENLGSVIVDRWFYYPKTNKVVNGVTFKTLNK